MINKAWSSVEEVPYCFARSSVKFQRRTALKIVKFDPNWAFPDCNSSLNSPMAMKCCTKLETAKERCPFVFQGHPSNFKVTRYKTSPILTQIGRFRTIGRSQLSNPSDLPCFSNVRVGAKEGGSHYWEMAVAITCGYGGYLLPLLAAHSSWFVKFYGLWHFFNLLNTRFWVTCFALIFSHSYLFGLSLWTLKFKKNGNKHAYLIIIQLQLFIFILYIYIYIYIYQPH